MLFRSEPRFKGRDVVEPQEDRQAQYAFSSWQRLDKGVRFRTKTWGNPTTTTRGTQALCLEVEGDPGTLLRGRLNGTRVEFPLGEILRGPKTGYLGGFLTPTYCFHRAVPREEYQVEFKFQHHARVDRRDWYYLRVRQHNGQWAWTSPIWVETEDKRAPD